MPGLDYYIGLLKDRARIDAFARAIRAVVRPGDHVVEIGCGVGTYALMAAQAGAARVTAIDADPLAVAMARELGVGERVRLVESLAQHVVLEPRADVVLYEDLGNFGHRPELPRLLEVARARLAKPSARYVVARVELFLALTDQRPAVVDPEESRALPFTAEACAWLAKRALNTVDHREVDAGRLLSEGRSVGMLDLAAGVARRASYSARLEATRAGEVTGLLGWMRLVLAEGISLDYAPTSALKTWSPIFFPVERPLACAAGDVVDAAVDVASIPEMLLWKWSLRSQRGGCEGTSVNGLPGMVETLRRGLPTYVPQAGPVREAIATICRALDGTQNVTQIAQSVYNLYGPVVGDLDGALQLVLDVSDYVRRRDRL